MTKWMNVTISLVPTVRLLPLVAMFTYFTFVAKLVHSGMKFAWILLNNTHLDNSGWTNQHVGIYNFTAFVSQDRQFNRFANINQIANVLPMGKTKCKGCMVSVKSPYIGKTVVFLPGFEPRKLKGLTWKLTSSVGGVRSMLSYQVEALICLYAAGY